MITKKQFGDMVQELRSWRVNFYMNDLRLDGLPVHALWPAEIHAVVKPPNQIQQGEYKIYTYKDFESCKEFYNRITLKVTASELHEVLYNMVK